MKKDYIVIGVVVLTIGYFVWRNNKDKKCKCKNGKEYDCNAQYHIDPCIDFPFGTPPPQTTNTATCPNGVEYDPNAQYFSDPCA